MHCEAELFTDFDPFPDILGKGDSFLLLTNKLLMWSQQEVFQ